MSKDRGPASHWFIRVPRERLLELLDEGSFLELVRLMRAVNSLRFGQHAIALYRSHEGTGEEADGTEYPSKMRTRNCSFLYLAALLYEIAVRGPNLERYFSELETCSSYVNVVNEIRRDRETFEIIMAIRNKFVFHFDREELKEGVRALPHDPFVVFHGYRNTQAEAYYEIADFSAIAYLIGLHEHEEVEKRFRQVIGRTTEYILRYLTASERLIGEALVSFGLEIEEEVV